MPKKEIKVPNFPCVYRVVDVDTSGNQKPTGQFRVRRRVQRNNRWTTVTDTVSTFEEAKRLAKTPAPVESTKTAANCAVLFKDAFASFMVHKKKERKLALGTIAGYWARYEHLKFFEPLPVTEINPRTLDAWIGLLLDPEYLTAQQGSRISYDHEYTLLVSFFRYYRNFIDETFVVPALDRHRQRACARPKSAEHEIRFLNSEEENQFVAGLAHWPTIQDLALLQLHTGARIGEAAAIEFKSIDFSRNEIRIAQHLHWERHKDGEIHVIPGTKSGPTRVVPLTTECRAMLQRRRQTSSSSIVFGNDCGRWLNYRSVQAIYDRVFKRIGLRHTGTHVLRHTFAVRFLDQTKDIYALQKLLGHTDLKVTQVYAKYSNESVRRSFQLFKGGMAEENLRDVPQLVLRIGS